MKTRQFFLMFILTLWFGATTADVSPLNIDESNVDLFLPTPTFFDEFYRLHRSYQPFGEASTLDFETAVIRASTGSVRITQLKINGVNHWVDLILKVKPKGLVLEVNALGTGMPPAKFPRWVDAFPELELDFNLSSADIFGPPARIRLFDVGVNNRLYDIDFVLDVEANFLLSNLYEKGFVLYSMTPDEEQVFIVASQSDELFTYSDPDYIDFSETVFLSPLALPWEGEDGEQSILINYATGSQLQTMMATDGILLGAYTPPVSSTFFAKASTINQRSITTRATLNTELNLCIDKKTELIAGFKADNKLSEQLVDMVFTLAGHSAFKLSNSTLEKIRGTIADSKDAVLEMMANGKADSTTLGIFVSSTLLKNLTPEEHQRIIEQIWDDNNIPNHVQTAANTSGAAAETNYKLAAQALAEGIASTAFPAYTAAVKTVQESVKYTKDTLANDSFNELYKIYKASNGQWEDVVNASVLSTNKFADQKVRAILKNQGKAYDDRAVEIYLEEKMKTLYENEPLMAKEKEKLKRIKEKYLDLFQDEKNTLHARMNSDHPSSCDLFQKYLDYVSRTEVDLKNSLRNCDVVKDKPTSKEIETRALFLTKFKLRDTGTAPERKAAYQKDKLQWLKSVSCLNYVNDSSKPSDEGVWELAETISYTSDFQGYKGTCYTVTGNVSEGSYNRTISIPAGRCNRDVTESVTFTGSWTSPPGTLVPGEQYSITMSLTRSNPIVEWGGWSDDHIYMDMDAYSTQCGFGTSADEDISGSLKVFGQASSPSSTSWSGTFKAPAFGYAGSSESKKFQIRSVGMAGCVRYIYEWSE